MIARKNPSTGKWDAQYSYTDWQGKRKKTTKRGFRTKREAVEWYDHFRATQDADFNMLFKDFIEIYMEDQSHRLRQHTMMNKRFLFDQHIIPYFGNKKVNAIKAPDIRAWQNKLMATDLKPTYLKTINNQLNAVFNYAMKYYDLKENPCRKAGSMGKSKAEEMHIWTREEFTQFLNAIIDKKPSYIAFEVLFWTGLRLGELLAMTPADIDFDKRTLRVNKSYQRLKGEDVVTPPKTSKSIRTISIPKFLAADLMDYINSNYGMEDSDRLFPYTKYFFEHELKRGIKLTGLHKIRVHDTRHSHAAHLIHMGASPLQIRDRLGHEDIKTTLNTYGHLYPNTDQKMAEQLESEYREEIR